MAVKSFYYPLKGQVDPASIARKERALEEYLNLVLGSEGEQYLLLTGGTVDGHTVFIPPGTIGGTNLNMHLAGVLVGTESLGVGIDDNEITKAGAGMFWLQAPEAAIGFRPGDSFSVQILGPGKLDFNDVNTRLQEGAGNAIRHQTDSGYIDVGAQNASYGHIYTDRPSFAFNKGATFLGQLKINDKLFLGPDDWIESYEATNAMKFFIDNSERLRVDNGGRISVTAPYGCDAYYNAVQTYSDSVWTDMSINSERYDSGGNLSGNLFTIPVAGLYAFGAMARLDGADPYDTKIQVYHSSGASYEHQNAPQGDGYNSVFAVRYCNASETLKPRFFVNHTGGSTTPTKANTQRFWVARLS